MPRLAVRVKGSHYETWLKDGLITAEDLLRLGPAGNFGTHQFTPAMDNADKIHFALKGFKSSWQEMVEIGREVGRTGRHCTARELYEVLSNRSWYNKATFYDENWDIIDLPFLGD